MKKKYFGSVLGLFLAATCFMACDNDALDEMQGVYDGILIYTSQEATVQPTVKLKKGIKALNIDVKDEHGTDIQISLGSGEWILQPATYTVKESVAANKDCVVKVAGETMKSGDLDVSLIGGKYYMNGLFVNQEGKQVKVNYVGVLSFEVGVDDPEASGYTISIVPSQIIDWSTGAPVVVNPNATKYTIVISNPAGQPTASLEAVNENNLQPTSLAGEYTIQGNASEPWLMGNGYAFPQYGFMGGSYFVDDAGVSQYITDGKVTISSAKDAEGQDLFSFEGNDLETQSGVDGSAGKGSFKIKYAAIAK